MRPAKTVYGSRRYWVQPWRGCSPIIRRYLRDVGVNLTRTEILEVAH